MLSCFGLTSWNVEIEGELGACSAGRHSEAWLASWPRCLDALEVGADECQQHRYQTKDLLVLDSWHYALLLLMPLEVLTIRKRLSTSLQLAHYAFQA